MLTILLTAFAFLNEHVVKPAVRLARPSHTFMIKQTHSTANLDSLYTLEEDKRKSFFQELVASDTLNFKSIDLRILNHWVDEAGYSFPSGHSFNAFLLGSILAFGIYDRAPKKLRRLYFIPLLWASLVALSRVAVGAHSAMDVSVGAGLGIILSHTLLGIKATRNLIIPKNV
jgi:phosphatidylglycerophosphatase B